MAERGRVAVQARVRHGIQVHRERGVMLYSNLRPHQTMSSMSRPPLSTFSVTEDLQQPKASSASSNTSKAAL